jgi:hypothetical protein
MRLARTASPLPRRSGRQESNLRSPAPEAGGVANSPTARRSAPGGTRTRSFRVEGPASSPVRPRGRSSGGRDRTCASRVTVARLAARPHRNEAEGDPGRIRTCTSPIKSRQLCQLSYGAEVWSAGVEPARPAFQAGALPFELRPQRWATLSKLRDKGSNLDLHVQSVASFRLRRSRIGGRPAGAGEHPAASQPSRASVHLPERELDAAARPHGLWVAVSSVTPGPIPNDVFQATRLPFDPGSPAGSRTCAPVAVLRGGVLEPVPRSLPDKWAS